MVVRKYSFYFLILVAVGLWLAVFSLPDANFYLIACDVGEGDALLATEGKIQILIDGGPDNQVLACLGKYLPFWDREIELVILTHPDKDHYGGLVEVFKRYKVDNYLSNGLTSSSQSYEALRNGMGGRGIREVIAKKGTGIRVGKIYLDVVSPEEAVNSRESNDNSLAILLKYADFEAVLTGDAPKEILNQVLPEEQVEYIKLSHHGSKTGTDAALLDRVRPKMAVISVGKNSYGHPDEEVLKILRDYDTKILRTDLLGDIEVVSDGKSYWIKK